MPIRSKSATQYHLRSNTLAYSLRMTLSRFLYGIRKHRRNRKLPLNKPMNTSVPKMNHSTSENTSWQWMRWHLPEWILHKKPLGCWESSFIRVRKRFKQAKPISSR